MIVKTSGNHGRQDSMEPDESWGEEGCHCVDNGAVDKEILKPLERRKLRHQRRCLAHSLVGTPNYIAPEVLLRSGTYYCPFPTSSIMANRQIGIYIYIPKCEFLWQSKIIVVECMTQSPELKKIVSNRYNFKLSQTGHWKHFIQTPVWSLEKL